MSSTSLSLPLDFSVPTDRFLAAIVESSDDAIIGKTLEGTITSWNRGAERLYGYSAEEAVGQQISLIIPPERPNELPAIMEQLRRGERIDHYETIRVH
ncbi:MAG: Chemotaxis protein methyltransferase CheR, partial [Thermomicrobiales bacterium]|nr:Chemotaxis protein methyltransferase CheR [Thermomicrobiales bacterium]